MRYGNPVWYASSGWTDRYFSLRRFPTVDGFRWCLFFRRAELKGKNILPFDTCQVCSDDSMNFYEQPACNVGGIWRTTGFAGFENSIHHNMAFLAKPHREELASSEAVAFGGRYPGVWRLTAELPMNESGPVWKFHKEVEISHFHPGCVDFKLTHFAYDSGYSYHCRFPNCGCALDGRLSLVSFQNQRFLYARANVKPLGGGRFVQVARQKDGAWGAFSLIHIHGYDLFAGDIYMFHVYVNPGNESTLVSFFPILDRSKNRSSLAISFSEDGVWWSSIVDLLASIPSFGGRTFDHPVDGIEVLGDLVYFFVHHNVPGIGSSSDATDKEAIVSSVHRYFMRLQHLQRLTTAGISELREEKLKYRVEIPAAFRGDGILDASVSYRVGMDEESE